MSRFLCLSLVLCAFASLQVKAQVLDKCSHCTTRFQNSNCNKGDKACENKRQLNFLSCQNQYCSTNQ
jgi:hypothetical protein